ncbi:MAG TPA: hypothetical protein VD968_14595 [Pyrinomonadaceae bacterium]|nr:hypothetical protein [Pyrinomonadaceae bacterium]
MAADWQISFGDSAELLRPAYFALSAILSTLVLHDARRRVGFGPPSVAAWALLVLAFPPVFLPLYLAARLFTSDAATSTSTQDDGAQTAGGEVDEKAAVPPSRARGRSRGVVPAYALTLVAIFAAYFYADYGSFDAHMARAERAKLYNRPARAVEEYRAALAVREDAHARKLLGLELLAAGRAEEALAEFRAAEAGGEPDAALAFHIARALDALGRGAEAAESYRRFINSGECAQEAPPPPCARAAERLASPEGKLD